MKLIFRQYLASLRERRELDAVIPDLLSELGYTVTSRPSIGTRQYGVDVAALSPADAEGKRKLYLLSLKQGDLTRPDWDGTPQALRSSINEIIDVYIPTVDGRWLILPRYTQPDTETKMLLHKLRMDLPVQPPPRITSNTETSVSAPARTR